MVAPTHEEIRRLTEAIRSERQRAGELGAGEKLTRHVPLNWTQAQKQQTKHYQPGMVLAFHKATKEVGKHESVEVVKVEKDQLTARKESGREITMIFGAMRDKAIREIGEILFPITSHVILTSANNPRAATPEEIREAAARVATGTDLQEAEDVTAALAKAKKLAEGNGLVVITGSIYIVGEAMRILGIRI